MPELPEIEVYLEALATFEFESGTLVLTEAGSKRRASLHLVEGEAALAALDPGGLEVLAATPAAFAQRIVHADNELNYCARCQTGGRILADRALSRVLHDTFPRTLDDL